MEDNQPENTEFKYSFTDKSKDDQSITTAEESQPSTTIHHREDKPLLNWSAPDSFSANKNILWYLTVALTTLALAAAVYFVIKDRITTGVILLSGLLFGVYAAKKPKTINYQLSQSGFTINGKQYNFGSYRSFSIINHGDKLSAVLTPLSRFMPYMYIYFGKDVEKQITSTLTDILPKEMIQGDIIDRALRRVGF